MPRRKTAPPTTPPTIAPLLTEEAVRTGKAVVLGLDEGEVEEEEAVAVEEVVERQLVSTDS